MYLHLDVINILVATIAVANIFYGLIVYSRNRDSSTNVLFFVLTLAVSAWGITMFLYRSATTPEQATIIARTVYIAAASIPIAFLYFVKTFPSLSIPETLKRNWWLPLPYLAVLTISALPLLITDVQLRTGDEHFIVFNKTLHILYALYIFTYFGYAYVLLALRYFKKTGLERVQLGFIFLGTFVATSIGVVTNLLLPLFDNFSFNWLGQIGTFAMISFITYAILKHHLFSIQVIATEVFMVGIWIALFSRIFVAEDLQERIFAIVLFTLVLVAGALLIRSVIREVKAREHIEQLAKDLRAANERLKELDKLKSQFLSIASHDLRAPLTAVRNFLSLLMDGTYGKIPPAAEEGMRQVFDRATAMAQSVDTYLNVSRIEQGRMKYDFAEADLAKIITDTVSIFKPIAEQKGLRFSVQLPADSKQVNIKADQAKLQEVFNNLIDNSIKYTPSGSIAVSVERTADRARVVIKDTGVGMTDETKRSLFKLFSPGEDSKIVNPSSTGIGLYISKAHIEAHKGTVRAESDGKGRGSTFVVELPINASVQ